MINTTMDYRLAIEKNRRFRLKDRIILKNGEEVSLSMEDVTAYSINEAASANGKFEIGAAIVKEYKASLNNMDGRFDEVDFEEADISAKVGLCLMDGSWEDLRKGEFRIVEAKAKDLTIDIKAYDGMLFFDRPYSQSTLNYPAAVSQILMDACTSCQMTLNARSIQMGSYVVNTRPESDTMTFRDMVSYCAQIMGCYAFINNLGQLDFGWYDFELLERLKNDGYHGGVFDGDTPYATGGSLHGGRFAPWNAGDAAYGGAFVDMGGYHHIYMLKSQSININDVTITGISVSVKGGSDDKKELVMYGEEGYVLELSDNPLIQRDTVQEVLDHVGRKVVGNTFRPLKITTQSDPCMEAGDLFVITDRKQRSYWSVITNTTFSLSGTQKIECGAETPTEKNYTRYGAVTKLMAMTKDQTENQLSAYDIAAKHFASLMARSMGLYETYETQEDGSVIKYQHDKPQLADSKTIWKQTIDAFGISTDGGKTWNAGTDANGNAIYNVLSVIGILAEWINTRGLVAKDNDGNITFEVDANTGRVNIVANTFSLSGKTIDAIAQEKADKAQENASRELEDFVGAIYDPKIASLQSQIDGQIETWYYDYQPTLSNIPASGWKTEADRVRHEGDLFYWKSKGYSYRFFKDGSTWKWQLITDSDITKALQEASRAQDTADSKRRIFLTTPVPPYDKGDLWTQGKVGGILRCKNARSSGGYTASDWEDADGYINEDEARKIAGDAVGAQTQMDILNKLTNDGADKGIYLQNGKLYISFSAAKGGVLTLGGRNNGDGYVEILDADGNEIGKIDKDGINGIGSFEIEKVVRKYTAPSGETAPWGLKAYINDILYTINGKDYASVGFRIFGGNFNKDTDTSVVSGYGDLCLIAKNSFYGGSAGSYQTPTSFENMIFSRSGLDIVAQYYPGQGNYNYNYARIHMKDDFITLGLYNEDGKIEQSISISRSDGTKFIGKVTIPGIEPTGEGSYDYASIGKTFEYAGHAYSNFWFSNLGCRSIYCDNLFADASCHFYSWVYFDSRVEIEGGDLKVSNLGTMSSSRTVIWLSNTFYVSSSSSIRYKEIDRRMSEKDIEDLYRIEPVLAKYKDGYLDEKDERVGVFYPMFIAEDVESHFPGAVDHNEDGEAETWNERIMIPAMFQMIKTQKETIDTLTERIDRLEALLLKGGE